MGSATALRRLVATVGAVAGLVALGTAPSSAGSWSHVDPTGDLLREAFADPGPEGPVPDHRAGDVRRVDVHHTATHIVVRAQMRALPRSHWELESEIRTGRGTYALRVARSSSPVEIGLFRRFGEFGLVQCRGLRGSFDRDATSVRLVVPRSCVGSPRVVRVSLGVVVYGFDDSFRLLEDGLRSGVGETPTLSPRISRG